MKKLTVYGMILVLLLSFVSALEMEVGEEISIKEDLNENLLTAGGMIIIDASVVGDVMAFGGEISINSQIDGDLLSCGGT